MFKKLRFLAAFLVIIFLSTSFAGCSLFQNDKKAAKEILRDMKSKMYDVNSSEFSFTPKLKIKSLDGDGDLSITIDGKYDKSDDANKKFDVNITIAASMDAPEVKGEASLDLNVKAIDKKFYLKINEFTLPPELEPLTALYKTSIDTYIQKWIEFSSDLLPANIRKIVEEGKENKSDKGEKIRKLVEKTDFFDIKKNHGTENIDGIKVYHYEVVLNKENLKNFVEEMAKVNEEPVKEDELMYENLTVEGDLWIRYDDHLPHKSNLKIDIKDQEKGIDVSITFEGTSKSFNKPQEITKPAESVSFLELLATFSGGAGFGLSPATDAEAMDIDDVDDEIKDIDTAVDITPPDISGEVKEIEIDVENAEG